jgi:hypothetical protein
MNNIKIIDNFLKDYEINEFYEIFEKMNYSQNYDDKYVTGRYLSFATKKHVDKVGMTDHEEYIYNKFLENNLIYPGERVNKIFYNALRVGDKFRYHQDWDGHTFLLYVNKEWKFHWGSHTIFKTSFFTKKVLPSPGRLIIFPGKIFHKASAPTFFCKCFARYSLVYQFSF